MLLRSKGRSASVSVDEERASPIINRGFRSVSNQIEEDAVNGLLVDLLSPMAENRRATTSLPVHSAESRSDSDSGVSDSSDSEGEEEETFFPDNVGSPMLGSRKSGASAKAPPSASDLLSQLKGVAPPPAKLETQASVLSWREYLQSECPVCQELIAASGDKAKVERNPPKVFVSSSLSKR